MEGVEVEKLYVFVRAFFGTHLFKLALYNRFEGLQQLMEEELSVDDKWRLIEQGYVETCG